MVLFVGEGKHDVGQSDFFATEPTPAEGFICKLAQKVAPQIANDSAAMTERQLQRLDRNRPKGLEFLVRSAVLVAQKKGFHATVIVKDRDGKASVAEELQGAANSVATAKHPVVAGIAVESVEAWVLGARAELRTVLGVTDQQLNDIYKPGEIETFLPTSGKTEKHSKALVEAVARLGREEAHTGFREQVADEADIAELERHCPLGFKPFAARLRQQLGSEADS